MTASTSHPTNHHVGNPAIIVLSILSGVSFAVLAVGAMFYYKRKSRILRRQRRETVDPDTGREAVTCTTERNSGKHM